MELPSVTKNQKEQERQSLSAAPNENNCHDKKHSDSEVHQALQSEYRDMAHWYDRFWATYLERSLQKPLDLVIEQLGTPRTNRDHQQQQQQQSSTVLVDVGCGTGQFFQRLIPGSSDTYKDDTYKNNDQIELPNYEFHGIEPSAAMLQQARKKFSSSDSMKNNKLSFWQAPAERIPLSDGSVDIIVSTSAFHFFGNHIKALQEMYRILKPIASSSASFLIITDWCADYWLVKGYHMLERIRWNFWHRYDKPYPGPMTSTRLRELVQQTGGFTDVKVETYRIRIFGFIYWGMQTLTAKRGPESAE